MDTSPQDLAPWIVSLVSFCAALFERLKNKKKEDKTEAEQDLLNDAKRLQERASLLGKLADDNAANFAKEQVEHQKTRDYWHDRSNQFQADLSKCQEKLAEVSSRPDYTEMLEILKGQGVAIEKILILIDRHSSMFVTHTRAQQ